jgi:hypothetical protein
MPTNERLLELALKGLEADRAKIDEEIAEIRKHLNSSTGAASARSSSPGNTSAAPLKKKRTMSAEARRRISEGMKRRYAEARRLAKKSA